MATPQQNFSSTVDSRTKIIVAVVVLVAASVIGGLFYLLMRASGSAPSAQPRLEGAIRQGSPEWAKYGALVVCDGQDADQAARLVGDKVMWLKATVRNLSSKTINGLEVRGAAVDKKGKSVKESTIIVIPGDRTELGPGQTMVVHVTLEGITDTEKPANIKVEVTGFRFKPDPPQSPTP